MIGGIRAPIRSLIGIGRVVVAATDPLARAIAADHGLELG
jgi:hypothetical protein